MIHHDHTAGACCGGGPAGAARAVAGALGVDEVEAEVLPDAGTAPSPWWGKIGSAPRLRPADLG